MSSYLPNMRMRVAREPIIVENAYGIERAGWKALHSSLPNSR